MKMTLIFMAMLILVGCNENASQQNTSTNKKSTATNNTPAPPNPWPPVVGKEYPNLTLKDQNGNLVELKQYQGKVIIIEPIGMTWPACNAFAGAAEPQIGKFNNIRPQADLPSFKSLLKDYGGLELEKSDIVYVHLLLYDLKMKVPSVEDAAAWANHFQLKRDKNQIVLAGAKELQGSAGYNMVPGFQLIDKDFVLRADSTGHRPKHNLYNYLLPMIKKL